MNNTMNGIIIDESIAKRLSSLQGGYADAIARGLDDAIGFILENIEGSGLDPRKLINVLGSLHNARTELMGLIPEEKKGGAL